MATGHIPRYVVAADGSDYLFSAMVVFFVVLVVLIGVGYLTLHSVPEKMAHENNHPQFQLVGILALLALFTHNGLFWVAAILVAGFQFPDFATPLRNIADAIRSLSRVPAPERVPEVTEPTPPVSETGEVQEHSK
ncbi:hypothetical protein GS646_12255 [Ruegeria sp. HKCCD4315]|nr:MULTISPECIES: hypothetical protein [unclassified Ruegeria]NOD88664.1 hypothetical protein [Ruegeria sp. HKCCD4318]NOE12108.1 hypothetical protein [Ruegeria sp. HKCCD4318-2]NOG09728.1 hypothetical protein [Ruegeria sp. HKCCD4315]